MGICAIFIFVIMSLRGHVECLVRIGPMEHKFELAARKSAIKDIT